jgi:polyhydroxybutyrate depolymerase
MNFSTLSRIPRTTGAGTYSVEQLRIGQQVREYLLYQPVRALPVSGGALVLVFHGGGKHARSAVKLTGFSALADREGFLVVYPEGIDEHWNDGRGVTPTEQKGVDDVAFTSALVDVLSLHFPINSARVFATGMSNGGMLLYRLGLELSGRIAAIAPVAGPMAANLVIPSSLPQPVSALLIQGTNDPVAPYSGGVMPTILGGRIRSFSETCTIWAQLNGCAPDPLVQTLSDTPSADGTRCEVHTYQAESGAEVISMSVMGGGHTWPGGPQYLPVDRIGRASQVFDATAAAWDFFQRHPLIY